MSLPSFTWSFASAGAVIVVQPGRITPGVDWALDDDGDLVYPRMRFTTGIEAVAQGIQIRLQLIRGELFLDTTRGVPWLTEILGQKANLPRLRSLLRKEIVDAPGVARIESLVATYDSRARRADVTADIRTTEDLLLTLTGTTAS